MAFENNRATYETPAIDIYDFQIESIMTDSVITGDDNDGEWGPGWNEYQGY